MRGRSDHAAAAAPLTDAREPEPPPDELTGELTHPDLIGAAFGARAEWKRRLVELAHGSPDGSDESKEDG
jgi:hypothetical protein